MTALAQYRRLEATGLWRESPEDQRREVLVALGEATLVISSLSETALTHWSLPAVTRLNPGRRPALYAPGEDTSERLELEDDDMIAAIEKLRKAIDRRRPHPGRLRLWISAAFAAVALGLAVFWLPGALTRQTVALLPEASRAEIGQQLLSEMARLAGTPCSAPQSRTALRRLVTRTLGPDGPRVVILPSSVPGTIALPGGILVAHAALVEDHEMPDVLAGYLIAEEMRRHQQDPVLNLLTEAGLPATFRLLTTGHMATDVVHQHAASLLSRPRPALPDDVLLSAFAEAGVSSVPYAYARDVSGETTLALIEADPTRAQAPDPLLTDADWVSLQNMCAN